MKKVAFLGLGVMGFHIASHLLKSNKITVYNRTIKKSLEFKKRFKKKEIIIANSPAEAVKDNEIVFSCLGNDNDLIEVYFSNSGIYNSLLPNTYIIDHTTVSSKTAVYCYKKFNEKKCSFLDAPVSGGEIGAINGSLSIMVGGKKATFTKLEKILQEYSKSLIYMGKSGNGQLAKMVNQICVAGVLQGLSEGLNFGKKNGLIYSKLISAIQNGAAQSWQMDNRSKTMWNDKFNFGFMNKWMKKDLLIVDEIAKEQKIPIPITSQIIKRYSKLIKLGFDKLDTSSLIKLLKN